MEKFEVKQMQSSTEVKAPNKRRNSFPLNTFNNNNNENGAGKRTKIEIQELYDIV